MPNSVEAATMNLGNKINPILNKPVSNLVDNTNDLKSICRQWYIWLV